MKFAEPIWLLAGLAVCGALAWLYRRYDARQRTALAAFASDHLLAQLTSTFSRRRLWLKRLLFAGGIALIFIALARPQWGFRWEETRRRGIDILFAVDTSNSMLAQDVKPDRLTRAKLAVTDLVNKLDGDRVGLIAFAGTAYLQSPLTLDYDAFQQTLDALDTHVISVPGTDVASAITAAEDAFGKEEKNVKILVLMTDGEDLEAQGIEAAKAAAKDGLKIYTVGVGSTAGDLIPMPSEKGGTEFLKDEAGNYVKSHLDDSTLKQIASATGGMYEPLGPRGEGLEKLYKEALAPLPKQELMSRMRKVFTERFQWPLALGLACLLAEMLVGTRKRRAAPRATAPAPSTPSRSKSRPAATTVLLLCAAATAAQASPQSAEKAYKKGQYDDAEKEYQQTAEKDPQSPENQFNLGAAAYKAGDLDKSLSAFQKALQTDKLDLQQKSYYNLGNTQYRIGQKTMNDKPDETINAWKDAVQSYKVATDLKPEDADGKYNLTVVKKKLEQLEKQQQQMKQGQGDKNKDQKNQDMKDQKDQKGQKGRQSQMNQQQSQSSEGDKGQKDSQALKDDSKGQKQAQKPSEAKQADASKADASKKDEDAKEKKAATDAAKPDQPPGEPKSAIAQAKENKDKGDDAQQSEEQQAPGQMTVQEARALLDSLKKDERPLPNPTGENTKANLQTKTHRKNW